MAPPKGLPNLPATKDGESLIRLNAKRTGLHPILDLQRFPKCSDHEPLFGKSEFVEAILPPILKFVNATLAETPPS